MGAENESGDIALEHETEEEPSVDALEVKPIPVVLADAVITSDIIPQHLTCYTVVLTSDEPMQQILPQDPLRYHAEVCSIDNPVVLCHSLQQAKDDRNVEASLPNPNGFLLNAAGGYPFPMPVHTIAPVWATAAAYPSRIAVLVKRRNS